MTRSPQLLETTFALIEAAAIAGRRCPERDHHGVNSHAVSALARAGRIRVEISGANFRKVTILTGPHAGKATAPDPSGSRPWKVIDASGTRINNRLIDSGARSKTRRQPSPPRLLTLEELSR